jgi:hypothetical protein
MGRAREFLKEQRVLEPAEFRIARIVGEQRTRAREHIFRRVAASVPNGLAGTLEDLLVVKPDETSSGLQAIKANPSKPSVDAMLNLLDKLPTRGRACRRQARGTWSVRIREVGSGPGKLREAPKATYSDGKGISLFTGLQISADYIKAKAQVGEMRSAMYAVEPLKFNSVQDVPDFAELW